MPFKSEKQRRYMFKKHPEIARRWTAEGKGYVQKSNDVENDSQEQMTNAEPSLFIDMPNSIRQLRVRDVQTGKFVPGSASLLATRFKRDANENSS